MSLVILLGNVAVTVPISILFALCLDFFVGLVVWVFFLGYCVLHLIKFSSPLDPQSLSKKCNSNYTYFVFYFLLAPRA